MPPVEDAGLASGLVDDLPESASTGGRTQAQRKSRKDDTARNRRAPPLYAAIDLGTNNCRLLIARPSREGFRVVDAFSRIVRLGEDIMTGGEITEAARERAITALEICARKIEKHGVARVRSVATEACRRAGNGGDFVDAVYARTGLALDVISTAEEARLAVLGCQVLIRPEAQHALVFDIGGGSTELILVEQTSPGEFDIMDWTSIPWGVVSLSERFGMGDLPPGAYQGMLDAVAPHIQSFEARTGFSRLALRDSVDVIGTSGTVTTLTGLHLGLQTYNRSKVDGALVPSRDLVRICQMLAGQSYAERSALSSIGSERADLVVAGCSLLESVLTAWPMSNVRVADRGIREGILRRMMLRDGFGQ
jgi:exopolyphosphatase / guanosine-5'-triphosphate,3'-diphosphate pyrophosphatase